MMSLTGRPLGITSSPVMVPSGYWKIQLYICAVTLISYELFGATEASTKPFQPTKNRPITRNVGTTDHTISSIVLWAIGLVSSVSLLRLYLKAKTAIGTTSSRKRTTESHRTMSQAQSTVG